MVFAGPLRLAYTDGMAPASRLGRQIAEVVSSLTEADVSFALIGGLALASHRVVRATRDIDLLVDLNQADAVEHRLRALGYRCLHRSADAGNYVRGDERVDLLFASRPIARRLLAQAADQATPFGALHVVSPEGLIGLKLQALINDPRRTQDLEDIRALLRTNRDSMNMTEVREYFRLFEKEAMLDELLDEVI